MRVLSCCVTLWLAIHYPQRFKKIIVSNTAAKIGQTNAWQDRANIVLEQGLKNIANSAPSRWFGKDFIVHHGAVVARLVDILAHQNTNGYAACCQALAVADVRNKLGNINTPLLSIGGEFDLITPISDAQFIADNIPNAAIATIAASHISNLERPDGFNAIIERFLCTNYY
ncbi:hypothetical protein [Moraxella cuniculi]|uniref:hypothetical protein n=1 Tax=Moraxella cuniculi TaxID=34061 RepID=UPI000F826693|nr:hypothetical protein [Moraxella cuniculi]